MAAILIGATSATARAETPVGAASISLDGSHVGTGCPSEQQLAAQVDAELASSARGGRSTDAPILVTIERNATGFSALVEVRGQPNARRQLQASRCDSLADALVVAIAVLLDGHADSAAETSDLAVVAPDKPQGEATLPMKDPPGSAPPPAIESSEQKAQSFARRRRAPPPERRTFPPPIGAVHPVPAQRGWSWGLWAQGGLASNLSNVMSAGAEFGRAPLQLRLGAWWEHPRDVELVPGYVSRVRFGGLTAGCLVWGQSRRLSSCAQAWLGNETYEGHSYAQPQSDHVFWGAFGPSVGIETGQHVSAGLELVGLVSPWQDRYVAPVSGNSQKGSPFSLWILLRLGLRQSLD